jgi:hypothetical protein
MSRIWKEKYDLKTACNLGIRELEGNRIIAWSEDGVKTYHYGPILEEPEWIYYVYVCGFTFAFFSVAMMQAYLDYYSQKVLPSRIRDTPHCNNDLRQDEYTRLPLYLREEPKRLKVIKALQKAIHEFSK